MAAFHSSCKSYSNKTLKSDLNHQPLKRNCKPLMTKSASSTGRMRSQRSKRDHRGAPLGHPWCCAMRPSECRLQGSTAAQAELWWPPAEVHRQRKMQATLTLYSKHSRVIYLQTDDFILLIFSFSHFNLLVSRPSSIGCSMLKSTCVHLVLFFTVGKACEAERGTSTEPE